jgi:hypothetical protein
VLVACYLLLLLQGGELIYDDRKEVIARATLRVAILVDDVLQLRQYVDLYFLARDLVGALGLFAEEA